MVADISLVPAGHLHVRGVIAAGHAGGVDETAEGVTEQVSTVGVELPSSVVRHQVDTRLVEEACDLDVATRPHELVNKKYQVPFVGDLATGNTHLGRCDGSWSNKASAVAVLGAVRDSRGFNVANLAVS